MLHSLARPVKGRWLATPSETRLLGVVILAIVALVFLSTLINPPHWLQVAALFGHLIFLFIGFGSVLAVDWYGLLSLFGWTTIGDVLLVGAHQLDGLHRLFVTAGSQQQDQFVDPAFFVAP